MPSDLNWSSGYFKELRQETDPIADKVIEAIIQSNQTMGINNLFNQLRENDDIASINFPEVVEDYFKETASLPTWSDPKLLAIGQNVFSKFGPEISLCLMCKSLPEAYACANGAKVLYATGRLTEQNGSLAVFTRRLMETAQFVVNVNSPGGLEPKGKGIVTAQKVRLIHAAIRYYLHKHNWPVDFYGEPINQQDMAGTLQSFSTLTLEGLDILKINLSEEEKQGYYHSWRVVGHIMGVKEELNPPTHQEGFALGSAILKNQIAPSKEGTELAQAVIKFMADMIPGKIFDLAPEAVIRELIGDKIADTLKLDAQMNLVDKIVPKLLGEFFDKIEEIGDHHQTIEFLIIKIKEALMQHMLNFYNHDKKSKFYIPPSLRADWKL